MHSVFGSKYQPFLDSKPLGPELDLCTSGHDPVWKNFDLFSLTAGSHTLRFKGTGASQTCDQWRRRFIILGWFI